MVARVKANNESCSSSTPTDSILKAYRFRYRIGQCPIDTGKQWQAELSSEGVRGHWTQAIEERHRT